MPEAITFERLAIEGFRGFNEPADFDLSASAIVVTGPNGTGKTSLFDAILWLLTGKVERLRQLRAHERDEWILNQYWSKPQARVSADIRFGDVSARVERTGSHRKSLLRVWQQDVELADDAAAHWLEGHLVPDGKISLEDLLTTSGLLQQDLMQRFVTEKAGERFRLLNELLGLEVLTGFQVAAQDYSRARKEAADATRSNLQTLRQERLQVEAKIAELQSRQQALPSVEAAFGDYETVLARHDREVGIALDLRINPAQVGGVSAELRKIRRTLIDVEDSLASLETEISAAPLTGVQVSLEEATAALTEARLELERRQQRYDTASTQLAAAEALSQNLAQLAALALPLLTDVCPVCGQDIRRLDVAAHLQQKAADVSRLVELRGVRDQSKAALTEINDRIEQSAQLVERINRGNAIRERMQLRRDQAMKRLTDLAASDQRVQLRLVPVATGTMPLDLPRVLTAIDELEHAIEQLSAVLASSVTDEELRNLRADLAHTEERQSALEGRVQALAQAQAEADTLSKASQDACLAVGRRRAQAIRPLVADVFSRLDPHPSFKTLDLEHEMYYSKATTIPTATDPIEGKTVNPALVFSTSQVNIAALSIFLALSFGAGKSALPFVLLDDPLQSLDDVNVLAFADLCRFIREERQLILSTHDRRFATLLARKLAPRRRDQTTKVIRFTGWERSGPAFEIEPIPAQLGIPRMIPA